MKDPESLPGRVIGTIFNSGGLAIEKIVMYSHTENTADNLGGKGYLLDSRPMQRRLI